MKRFLVLLCIMAIPAMIFSQYQNRNWIFGRPTTGSVNATLYFGNQPVPINPVINLGGGQPNSIMSINGNEQWAVVTNPFTGDIIFYTDGKSVFDHQHNLITSFDLGANVSSSQPVAIAPVPRSELKSNYNKYYIFSNSTGGFLSSYLNGTVKYRVYDYITKTFGPSTDLPGIYGTSTVTEGMKIIPGDNDPDILWLVVSLFPQTGMTNKYVVYKIDKNVISYHGDFDIGPAKTALPSGASPIVYITYSRANTSMGITNVGFAQQYSPAVFTCQFDNINGQFLPNTVKTVNTGYTATIPTIYSLEFSPGGDFLYYSVYRTSTNQNALFQVDLQDSALTPTLVKTFNQPYAGGLKQGPDSLIYHIHDDGYNTGSIKLGRLLQPDQKFIPGVTQINQFYLDTFQIYNNTFGIGLCEFLVIPYTVTTSVCPEERSENQPVLRLWPNPVANILSVEYFGLRDKLLTLQISNLHGQIVVSRQFNTSGKIETDISHIPEGIYLVSIGDDLEKQVKKLVVRR